MKKLLLILLCVPLLFSNCNKDDDTPGDNNNNNNNGIATFLENQDGTVWLVQNYQALQNVDYFDAEKIGFYNASVFMVQKNAFGCGYVSEGMNDDNYMINIISNSNNELHLRANWKDPNWPNELDEVILEYKFTNTNSINQINLEFKELLQQQSFPPVQWDSTITNVVLMKSTTETNLSCN